MSRAGFIRRAMVAACLAFALASVVGSPVVCAQEAGGRGGRADASHLTSARRSASA